MFRKAMIAASLLTAVSVTALGFRPGIDSGLKVGEMVTAFHPHHVLGPHKGTDACPPCTYGRLPAVQVWVNGDDSANVEAIAKLLDKRVGNWEKSNFKAFVIFVTDAANKAATAKKIQEVADKSGAKIALAWIDKGDEALENYSINSSPEVKNTVLVYKDMKVVQKFVNLKADQKGLNQLSTSIDGISK